jgi:hypothetical protein
MASYSDIAKYLLNPPVRRASLNLQMMTALGHHVFGKKRIDLFIASYDHGLLQRWWTEEDGWHPTWERRGGTWASKPAVVTSGDGRIYVFALGLNGHLYWTACQGNCDESGAWHREDLGHPENDRLISHPTATFDGGSVRIYARAESQAIWTISLNTALPINSGWQRLSTDRLPEWVQDEASIFAPAVASFEPGRVDLFAARRIPPSGFENPQSLDGELLHAWRDQHSASRGWRPPRTPEGGIPWTAQRITSGPEAVVWPRSASHDLGVVHIGACGEVNPAAGANFVLTSWLGRHWAPSSNATEGLGLVWAPGAVSSVTLASWGPPRLDLFYVTPVIGGNIYGGPWRAVHQWTESWSPGRPEWTIDETRLGIYPVEYQPGA